MYSKCLSERTLVAFSIILIVYNSFRVPYTPQQSHVNDWSDGSANFRQPPDSSVELPILEKTDLIYDKSRNTVPMVNEEFKVVFFQVAKAASSEWTRFFARLAGNPSWCAHYVHDNEVNGIKRLNDFSKKEAQKIMTDPTWTKAIFVRNPKTRLLSAFLDKFIAHSKTFANSFCQSYHNNGGDYQDCVENHEKFDFFIHNITTISWENVHWRPIYSRIDEKWWPYLNYVANMEHMSEDAQHFLESIHSTKDGVSAWDRIGKTGWSDNERDCNTMGTKAFLAKKDVVHSTNAEEKLRGFYTPELEKFVEEHYAQDFNNPYFHFSPLHIYPHDD